MSESMTHTPPALSKSALRAAFDALVLGNIQPITLLLSALLTFLGLTYVRAPRAIAATMIPLTLGITLLLLIINRLAHARRIPTRYAHPVAAGVAGLLLVFRITDLALTHQPDHTTNLSLILIGAGFILLATPWLIGVLSVSFIAWGVIVINAPAPTAWFDAGIALISATALTFIIHIAHRNSVIKHELLRAQNDARTGTLERQARQLGTLISAGQSINAILDLDTLLNYVVDLIQERFNYYFVGIFLLNQTKTSLLMQAGTGKAGQDLMGQGIQFKPGEQGLISWVGQHRETLRVNNIAEDARFLYSPFVPNTRAELILPLCIGDQFLGVLDIQAEEVNAFGDDDVYVFESLADQVATAINNAQMYQNERSRRILTESLYEVSRALSQTLNMEEVFAQILDNLQQIVRFDRGSVLLHNSDLLEIVAASGFPLASSPLQIRVPIHTDDVFWQISQNKQPLHLPDVLERPDWQHVEGLPLARSWIGIPVIDVNQDVIGMLSLVRETPEPYTEEDIALALAFAGHTAVAINNARLYTELARAYAQLERLDRTKSDFITVAAHELRTPLTVQLGFSQMLLKNPTLLTGPTATEIIGKIYHSGVRLQTIVNTMIDMARIDSHTLEIYREPLDIAEVLDLVVSQFREVAQERQLLLELSLEGQLPRIEADQDELSKIFKHLLTNAIKYTPNHGVIQVTGRAVPMGYHGLLIPGIEVVVQDTGIGIDPEFHDLIFTKFYQTGEVALHSSGTTKFKGGGPGLGLAIAKGIVEVHGGQIWVESPGHDEERCPGSAFHVWLPLPTPGTRPLNVPDQA